MLQKLSKCEFNFTIAVGPFVLERVLLVDTKIAIQKKTSSSIRLTNVPQVPFRTFYSVMHSSTT